MTARLSRPLPLPQLPADPLVSVLVANYNYERFLEEAIGSALAQTYGNIEIIVCDDGSSDGSLPLLHSIAGSDSRVNVIAKPNGGVASALNATFKASRGDILCLLDADDAFSVDKVARVVDTFSSTDWGLLVHPMTVVDGRGGVVQRKPTLSNFESGWIADAVVRRGGRWTYMEASAVCVRREVCSYVFPIPEDRFRTWADAYACLIGSLVAPVGFIDEELSLYRLHGSNVSGFSGVGAEQAAKGMDGIERIVTGARERLADHGVDLATLSHHFNLTFQESRLLAALLTESSSIPSLLRLYGDYLRVMLRDDIYSRPRKALLAFFLGTAMLLPSARRGAWISRGTSPSEIKGWITRLVRDPRKRTRQRA